MIGKVEKIIDKSIDRHTFCSEFVNTFNLSNIVEIGVYKGDFAQNLLKNCQDIDNYIMIDPWRNLSDWNKPANTDTITFNEFYQETLEKTDFAKNKRTILKGKTTEVIGQINDDSCDLAYIDGDHTLKGITIDLVNIWPKVKQSGFIIGDDFVPEIWQHGDNYEPTLVFPFAIYFAEAVNAKIFGLPYNQFLIAKDQNNFEFIDFTNGQYDKLNLKPQFNSNSRLHLIEFLKKGIKKMIDV